MPHLGRLLAPSARDTIHNPSSVTTQRIWAGLAGARPHSSWRLHIPSSARKPPVRSITKHNTFRQVAPGYIVPVACGSILLATVASSLIYPASTPSPLQVSQQARHISATGTMSSKLIPQNPSDVMVIRNVTPRIVTFSVPFLRFGVLKIGGRGTLVKLTSGGLAVFSPVALTPETKAKVAELGGDKTVEYIVAPDIEHHIFLSEWKAAYPDAKLIGPEGLQEKRHKVTNDPKIGHEEFFAVLKAGPKKREQRIAPDFDADFDYEFVDAHPNKELVFFFKPEKVMINADLMFNLPATEQYSRVPESQRNSSGPARWFASLQSPEGEAKGYKRLLWYGLSSSNRPGFNESVQHIDQWDFTTVIPCHGDTLEGNGKEVFRKVFEWHLKGKK